MNKLSVLESLIGEQVTVVLRDRKETTYSGSLMEISKFSVTLKLKEHGCEYIEYIPMINISVISHKLLSVRNRSVQKLEQSKQAQP